MSPRKADRGRQKVRWLENYFTEDDHAAFADPDKSMLAGQTVMAKRMYRWGITCPCEKNIAAGRITTRDLEEQDPTRVDNNVGELRNSSRRSNQEPGHRQKVSFAAHIGLSSGSKELASWDPGICSWGGEACPRTCGHRL